MDDDTGTPPAPGLDPEPGGAYDEGVLGAIPAEDEGAPVPGTPDDAPGPDPEPDPLTAVTAERDDYLDQLQRARADYDNLNKRRLREVAEARDRGAAVVADALLEVLDAFGYALQAAERSEDAQLAKGVELVHGQLRAVLAAQGLEEVPGVGSPFDPAHHEALLSERDDAERDLPEVGEVLRTGYRFKQQLLRPASVKVLE